MARGRLLNRSVCMSMKFHNMPDDTCRLLASWIISMLDLNGVFYGEAATVKSLVFTRRADVTVEQVESYLKVMEENDLIVRFEAKGELWMWWPGFDDNQPNLRKERETTDFPPPPDSCRSDDGTMPDSCRSDDGTMPAQEEVNINKEKGEEKVSGNGNHPSPSGLPVGMPPAVAIILEMTGQCHPSLYAQIDEAVGRDPPYLEFWEDVVRGWLACGWKPTNINGMLEYFMRDEVPGEKRPANGSQQRGARDGRSYIEGKYADVIKH